MKSIYSLVLLSLTISLPVVSADTDAIKDLIGKHKVLEWNGDSPVDGTVEIVADGRGVGYILAPTAGTNPVNGNTVVSPLAQTKFTVSSDAVVQNYKPSETVHVRITYKPVNKAFTIDSENCDASACKIESLKAERRIASFE